MMITRAPVVLLVDDNEEHRSMYNTILRWAGFRVIEAADGFSGISQARIMRPDVILMDLYMPGLDGWEACRLLKAHAETTRIPIIALTALVFEEAKQAAIDAGCERFVSKGPDPEQILHTIREVLARAA
jgi:CheY-like chemotaxis protein